MSRHLAWMLTGLMLAAGLAGGQDEPRSDRENIGSSLNGVNLHVLTEAVQHRTSRSFLWSGDLNLRQKTVHFKSDIPLDDPDILFKVYQNILQVSGFVLVPVGEGEEQVFKIVAQDVGLKSALPIENETGELSDRYITRLFSLQFISARDVHAALLNQASRPQAVLPIHEAGIVMITDYDYNIARFEKIIEMMDVKKPDIEMQVIQLRHALSSDVESMLNNLVQVISQNASTGAQRLPPGGARTGREQFKIVGDRRTNSLVVLAQPQRMEQILELVEKLDSDTGFETSGVYMIHLRHTNAEDIVQTLTSMFNGGSGLQSRRNVARPGQGAPAQIGGDNPFGTQPTIVSDAQSNSVLVVTDRNTYRTIEGVVRQLDQRRPQVLIKASVVEVTTTRDFDLGTELNAIFDPGRTDGLAGSGRMAYEYSSYVYDPTTGEPTVVPVDTAGITLGLLKDRFGNIAALLKAFEGKAKISILDEPEAATVDNGRAEMKVSNQVPILQTTVTATGIAQTTFSRFETAETTLSISPHISEGGYLRLNTTVKIEKFVRGGTTDPTIPPPKSTREISTQSIHVPNARTVVIGGIVTQDESSSQQGTPFLSDIPFIGELFKRRQEVFEKRTLYVFITPYILYDDQFGDFSELTRSRTEAIELIREKPLNSLDLKGSPQPGVRRLFQFGGRKEEE